MYSPILHGRRFLELQKWRHLGVSVQKAFALSDSFSSAADVSLRDGRKGKNFTVSYLVNSLGFTTKVAKSISKKVSFQDKVNPDSVLSLLRSYGFTDSQVTSIIADYPQLLILDAEKSLAPKLQFLQSRGASSSELTEIVTSLPIILGKKEGKAISRYYDFIKEIIEAGKSSKFEKLCHSMPQGMQENKIRNVLVLRELGVPQNLLFSLLVSDSRPVCGKERFEESLKKVVEMGFDPTTANAKFVKALQVFYQMSDKTIEEKVNVYKRLGFTVEDVWEMFKKYPSFLTFSEKKILNFNETFLGLGCSRAEFTTLFKLFPKCITYSAESVKKKTEFLVKNMSWPLKAVISHPQVLGYSMEKRIVPRCNVIKALISKGLLGERGSKLPPMRSVLEITDQDFLDSYVRKHVDKDLVAELMAIFTRDCAS